MATAPNGTGSHPKEMSRTFYVPTELKDRFNSAVTKIQRRRPGQSMSKIFVALVIEEADRHKDIPGLDIPLQEAQPAQNGHEPR